MKQAIAARALAFPGARALAGIALPWAGALVLNYHRIGDPTGSPFDRDVWSATPDAFDDQMRWLKARFEVIGPAELSRVNARPRDRFVLVTFDDGYRDNFENAFPILRRHNLTATFFVATGFLDSQIVVAWWDEIAWMIRTSPRDRLELTPWSDESIVLDPPDRTLAIRAVLNVFKRMPTSETGRFLDALGIATGTGRCPATAVGDLWMTWDMVRAMRSAGMTIGGHTTSHPVLSRLSRDGQGSEVSNCGRRLAAELGEPMRYFSYPNGQRDSFNDETRHCLNEAGVQYAFSYYGGHRTSADWDDLDVRRIAVETHMGPTRFRAGVTLPQLFCRPRA